MTAETYRINLCSEWKSPTCVILHWKLEAVADIIKHAHLSRLHSDSPEHVREHLRQVGVSEEDIMSIMNSNRTVELTVPQMDTLGIPLNENPSGAIF